MGLNIKNAEVERLASEAAARFGESKTQAIKKALEERLAKPEKSPGQERYTRLMQTLESQVWPAMDPKTLGVPISKQEEEEILGIGPAGI